MGSRRGIMVAAAALSIVVGDARSALPCSPGLDLYEPKPIPSDGAVDVPLNARVLVEWRGEIADYLTDEESAVVVGVQGGAEVDATITRVTSNERTTAIATPSPPLDADTVYEVLVHPNDCTPLPCTEWTVIATFTTGATTDDEPPVFAGLGWVGVYADICGTDCTCDLSFARMLGELRWTPAVDATPVTMLRYNVYRVGEPEPVGELMEDAVLVQGCSGMDFDQVWEAMIEHVDGAYYMRAVDMAGNEDDNTVEVDVQLDCVETTDAGPGGGDAGLSPHDAGSPADGDSGGCAAVDGAGARVVRGAAAGACPERDRRAEREHRFDHVPSGDAGSNSW